MRLAHFENRSNAGIRDCKRVLDGVIAKRNKGRPHKLRD
jgi:hypothetical protein